MKTFDAIVIGSGPAGCALSGALARRGVSVAIVAPDVGQPWPNNYGIWVDEKPGWLGDEVFGTTWQRPIVRFSGEPIELGRAYGRIDGEALRRALKSSAVHEIEGEVDRVESGADGHRVVVGDATYAARVVFDATGVGAFLRQKRAGNPDDVAAQTAYGVLARVEGEPLVGASMSLMDFDDSWRDPGDDSPATFLYAMQLDDLWFLEETVLVERPPHPIGDLREDLDRRLNARGARIIERLEEERCFIPMGTPLPSLDQPVVGFGASAGYVHPASGYSLAASLNRVESVAQQTVEVLGSDASSTDASRMIWDAVWPRERRRARKFYEFGMETLLTMDRHETMRFFDAFFELDEASWQGYLSDQLDVAEVRKVMLKLFATADMKVRMSLAAAAMGRNSAKLLRALLG